MSPVSYVPLRPSYCHVDLQKLSLTIKMEICWPPEWHVKTLFPLLKSPLMVAVMTIGAWLVRRGLLNKSLALSFVSWERKCKVYAGPWLLVSFTLLFSLKFSLIQFLEIAFHVRLLQDIGYIPHVIWAYPIPNSLCLPGVFKKYTPYGVTPCSLGIAMSVTDVVSIGTHAEGIPKVKGQFPFYLTWTLSSQTWSVLTEEKAGSVQMWIWGVLSPGCPVTWGVGSLGMVPSVRSQLDWGLFSSWCHLQQIQEVLGPLLLPFSRSDDPHPAVSTAAHCKGEASLTCKFLLQVKLDFDFPSSPSPPPTPFLGDRKQVWGEIGAESYLNALMLFGVSDFPSTKEHVLVKNATPKVLFLS